MENKYYTPDIEEFHIGFECEVNWSRGYTHDFEPFIFKIVDILPDGSIDAYNSNVDDALIAYDDGYAEFRVKYLDKEDIESLGWIQVKDYEDEGLIFQKMLEYSQDFFELTFVPGENSPEGNVLQIARWTTTNIGSTEHIKYVGKIRNKSELKKLMKQLNII